MRRIHRYIAVFAVFFGLYVGLTGTFLQLIDMSTLLSHPAENTPNLKAIREGEDGPPNFQVRTEADFAAKPLPPGFDFDSALAAILTSARAVAHGASLSFVELRMIDGKPVGQVASGGRLLRFDAATGAVLIGPDAAVPIKMPPGGNRPALRNTVKNVHRMLAYGDVGEIVFMAIALAMCVMIFTGLVLYFRLFAARRKLGRPALIWSAGGWWRRLHRAVAIVAGAFLVVVTLSGTLLAFGDLGVAVSRMIHHGRPGLTADVSSPLSDAELAPMLHTTLAAYRAADPANPIKALRLRHFAGMPQGIVVSGGAVTRQFAFDTATGREASLSGPGYPDTGQPFGWQEDQIVKGIHRGDALGMTGRAMSLLTGLSMIFLSLSGAAMYLELWKKRRRAGRRGLFWP